MNVIITGATKGIGLALAHRFAQEGANLALCARNIKELNALKTEFSTAYPSIKVLIQAADMQKKEEVFAFADFIKSHWTKVEVLINNAGVFLMGESHSEADGVLEQLIETNLYSAYYMTRAMLPTMLPHQAGHIFTLCSVASIKAYPSGGSYSISKFALLGMTKAFREELKDKGIRVTAILPGATWSDSWKGVDLPQERLMPASDIAEAVWGAYKLSNAAVVEELLIRPLLGDL